MFTRWSRALVLLSLPFLSGGVIRERPRKHTVEIVGFEFKPAQLRVARGDTIVWLNRDAVPHSATATNRTWDSGNIAAGASWSLVTTTSSAGDYFCVLHPSMKAKFTVRRGGDK